MKKRPEDYDRQLEQFARAAEEFPASSERLSVEDIDTLGRVMIDVASWRRVKGNGIIPERLPRFIGLDMGDRTGVAVWDQYERDFLHLTTLGFWRAVLCVMRLANPFHDLIIIEDPGINTHIHKISDRNSVRTAGRVGQKVGSVIEKTALIIELLNSAGYTVIPCEPRSTKIPAGLWVKVVEAGPRWQGRGVTSEHARDAGILVAGQVGTLEHWRARV